MRKRLTCSICSLPYATIVGRMVVIRSRHHGRVHENRIDILDLIDEVVEVNGTEVAYQILDKIRKSGIMIEETLSA